MKKLYEARLFLYALGLLISSGLERFITNAINQRLKLELVLYHTLSLFILITLFVTTNLLLKFVIQSKFVSRKIFGNKYVGGRWIEFVYDDQNEITGYCDLDIVYDAGEIYISGTNYDKNLKTTNCFETKNLSMNNYDLSYVSVSREGSKLWQGLGNFNFHRNSSAPPKRYSGQFTENERQFRIEGVLINDKAMLKKLDCHFVSNFRDMLPELEKRL